MRFLLLILLVILASGCAVMENTVSTLQPTPLSMAPENTQESVSEMVEENPTQNATSAPANQAIKSDLEDLGPAPEIKNDVWLNIDSPLRLAELAGKVVLLEMWTFG